MSFEVNNSNIFFDIENNSLSEDIVELLRKNKNALEDVTGDIRDYITSTELFSTIQWNSLIDLKNPKYIEILNRNSAKLAEKLSKKGITSLDKIISLNEKELQKILQSVIGRYSGMSPRKCLNY